MAPFTLEAWCRQHAATARRFARENPWLDTWPELRAYFLEELHHQPDWLLSLPLTTCLASGGTAQDGLPVAVAWMAMNQAAHLLDAIEDGDPLPPSAPAEPRKALNHSTALIFAACHLLADVQAPGGHGRVARVFAGCGFQATQGQDLSFGLDRSAGQESLPGYWRSVILKSGSLMEMAAGGGAAAGTQDPQRIAALRRYGIALGVILQILDDCRDMSGPEGDLSLPALLYATRKKAAPATTLPDQGQPGRREALHAAGIPQVIAGILARWQQRAGDSLEGLPPSTALEALRSIPQVVLQP